MGFALALSQVIGLALVALTCYELCCTFTNANCKQSSAMSLCFNMRKASVFSINGKSPKLSSKVNIEFKIQYRAEL
jgi:hypothetical protein